MRGASTARAEALVRKFEWAEKTRLVFAPGEIQFSREKNLESRFFPTWHAFSRQTR